MKRCACDCGKCDEEVDGSGEFHSGVGVRCAGQLAVPRWKRMTCRIDARWEWKYELIVPEERVAAVETPANTIMTTGQGLLVDRPQPLEGRVAACRRCRLRVFLNARQPSVSRQAAVLVVVGHEGSSTRMRGNPTSN